MKIWKWKAVDEKGSVHQGILEDSFASSVLSHLIRQKLYPVKISRSYMGALSIRLRSRNSKLYWAGIARKISTLLDAGVPLLTILDIILAREANPLRRDQWKKVSENIQSGKELFMSLSCLSPSPGPFFYAMVEAGEKSGTLAECLLDIAEHLEEEYFFEQKIKTTLFYPMLLLAVSLLVLYTLSVVVIPMYENLFHSLNTELPFATSVLFKVGSFIPYMILSFIIYILGSSIRRPDTLPGIMGSRHIMRTRAMMQFCIVLGRLLNAGITLRECLAILEKISQDKAIRQLTAQLKIALEEGNRISAVIINQRFFPLEAAKMLEVGEESGKMSEMLNHLGKMFKRELEELLQKHAKTLEPVLILGMSFVVGLIAIGVLLPIFDLSMHIN